jgi:hypothetical protein
MATFEKRGKSGESRSGAEVRPPKPAIKCLVIVDDAMHESVAVVAEHSIGATRWSVPSIGSARCVDVRQ